MKFIFPGIWISIFGLGTLSLWTTARANVPPELPWIFLAAWMGGGAFLLGACASLKRVRLDRDTLYISNFRQEIAVPLRDVDSVTENRWINIHPVTIVFRHTTELGDRITFMPPSRAFALWSSHPVVEELRSAVRSAAYPAARALEV
jgi:hypothetical protein